MKNRLLYVRKYHSSRLKEFGWAVENTLEESRQLGEVITLADNQILRTVRDVRRRTVCREKLEIWYKLRDHYRDSCTFRQSPAGYATAQAIRRKLAVVKKDSALIRRMKQKYCSDTVYADEAGRIQDKIDRTLFVEDYVVVVMDHMKHYEYLYRSGFQINGRTYRRFSCSAGQARVSTVVFCCTDIADEVKKRLNNGRDETKKLSPSKFNAYFGLAGSATRTVSEPKFIVVRDFINTASFWANYCIENGPKVDDTMVQRFMRDVPMNRTDGMGLISPRQAARWAEELGLDYVPSQFCIRQNFIKGMLCTFPIHEFCEEVNHGSYLVDTVYRNADGSPVKADLREYDVILSESQFKLWDSFQNLETYIQNCRSNRLLWGVSLTSPKEPKHMLKLNYQFIQTLDLSPEDVRGLAEPFVRWIRGVSYDDAAYMLLFLLGVNNTEEKIRSFLSGSDRYWVKALIADPTVKNDKYIRTKIRELIRQKIRNACKGDIYVEGNFQVLVSDPYGYMQHVCGLPVTGLLKEGEFYSGYWNERGVRQVDAMRSPLTYLSEHVLLPLRKDELTEKWYRYCRQGILLNYHGHETVNFAGADFDMDILATTPNPIMRKGIWPDELPVVYDAPKPKKILFTEDDLYRADTFSFGSIIGSITNKSSNAYALLPLLEQEYGRYSAQYQLVKSRLQQCCKAQSAQIDKAKIGREVKGIPKVWIHRNAVRRDKKGRLTGRHHDRRQLYNETLLNRYPYFFRYVYKDVDKQCREYLESADISCRQKYRYTLQQLKELPERSAEQEEFLNRFYRYAPVTFSDSPMNLLCYYIENVDFEISRHTKIRMDEEIFLRYKSPVPYEQYYKAVAAETKAFLKKETVETVLCPYEDDSTGFQPERYEDYCSKADLFALRMEKICSNPYVITNCLIDYFYKERPSSNKDFLWAAYGKYIYKNIVRNGDITAVHFPLPDEEGDIEYLGYRYSLREIPL